MKSKMSMWGTIITLFTVVAMPVLLAAQEQEKAKEHRHHHKYHHYQLVDVGTFGGPQSFQYFGNPAPGVINNRGTFVGWADTSAIDPLCFFDQPDCYVAHAFEWKNGAKTDLGVLPGGLNSQVNWISANGLNAGVADNGQMDPLGGIPQIHAVLWGHDRSIIDLGFLPEGGYQSFPAAVNHRGEVVGNATNTVPDPNSMFSGYGYQLRAFYWKNGVMQDIGTLPGGTDAQANLINERGQVIGFSYNSSNPNLDNLCFGNPLTTGSFIWDKKDGMRDLGNLGGASCTLAHNLNNLGQVVGGSDVPGEFQHPFVWDSETGITDLGTPDGGYGVAAGLNEHGDVVGLGEANGGPLHAIFWRKRGDRWHMKDLGTLNGGNCGFAESINESGQVVGLSGPDSCSLPFLWEDGGTMVDLNTLVPANSGIQLGEVGPINNRGEITVNGSDTSGNNHAVLLIPCDENHRDIEGCDYSMVDAATLQQSAPPITQHPAAGTPRSRMPAGISNRFRSRWGQRTPDSVTNPATAAEQTSSANTGSVDLEGEQLLGPLFGRYKGYFGVSGGKLTGYCTAFSYYSCLAKASTACPSGKTAIKPGYFQCSDRFSRYVDLGRGCGFN
jgi:probable HAF family extracellular repeat protein